MNADCDLENIKEDLIDKLKKKKLRFKNGSAIVFGKVKKEDKLKGLRKTKEVGLNS